MSFNGTSWTELAPALKIHPNIPVVDKEKAVVAALYLNTAANRVVATSFMDAWVLAHTAGLTPARDVDVLVADAVVGLTKTWTFANGAFVAGDVGGTITVAGATDPANNGTFTIASRTSATVIVTGGAPADETFGGTETLSVDPPDSPVYPALKDSVTALEALSSDTLFMQLFVRVMTLFV